LVRQLMRNHFAHSLLLLGRRGVGIDQQVYNSVGHQTPVLHRTSCELSDGDHVELGQRVFNSKVLFVEVKSLAGDVQSESPLCHLAWWSIHTDNHSARTLILNEIELTHTPRDQVGAHDWSI